MFSGREAAVHELVCWSGTKTEWESGWGGDLASGEIGGDVASVREPVFAGGGDLDTAGGCEAELALGDEDVVEAGENFAGVVRGFAAESGCRQHPKPRMLLVHKASAELAFHLRQLIAIGELNDLALA